MNVSVMFTNGLKKTFKNADGYSYNAASNSFVIEKDGYRHFLPQHAIAFIGLKELWGE